jgi:hypothetical protein
MASGSVVTRKLGLLGKDLGGKPNRTAPERPAGPSKALTPALESRSEQIANPPKSDR